MSFHVAYVALWYPNEGAARKCKDGGDVFTKGDIRYCHFEKAAINHTHYLRTPIMCGSNYVLTDVVLLIVDLFAVC